MHEASRSEENRILEREVEDLAQENKALSRTVRDLEFALIQKKREAETFLKSSEEQKKVLSEFLVEESDLVQEIEFYASEKKKLDEIYSDVSAKYDANMVVLEGMIKSVGFLKGEIGALVLKMSMLEEEIPRQFRDADNLDKKVKGTFIKALNDLQNRIDVVERNAKVLYYQKRK